MAFKNLTRGFYASTNKNKNYSLDIIKHTNGLEFFVMLLEI